MGCRKIEHDRQVHFRKAGLYRIAESDVDHDPNAGGILIAARHLGRRLMERMGIPATHPITATTMSENLVYPFQRPNGRHSKRNKLETLAKVYAASSLNAQQHMRIKSFQQIFLLHQNL